MTGWGEDPNKWVIQKSGTGSGWSVFPPNDGEAWIHPSFEAAVDAVAGDLIRCVGCGYPVKIGSHGYWCAL